MTMPRITEDFESTKEKNKMEAIRIMVDGIEWNGESLEGTAQEIEMWWDRSRREWVLYPIDEHGYQLAGASYARNKAEATRMKKDLAEEYGLN